MRTRSVLALLGLVLLAVSIRRIEPTGSQRDVRSHDDKAPHREHAATSLPNATPPAQLRPPGLLVRNNGQLDERVHYVLRDRNVSAFFERNATTFSVRASDRRLAFRNLLVGASGGAPVAVDTGRARYSSFTGSPSHWRRGDPTFTRLSYLDAWTGVDLHYDPRGDGLEYTTVVRPGGRVSDVRLRYEGVEQVKLSATGTLRVETAIGTFEESAPVAYQVTYGRAEPVPCSFVVNADGSHGFQVDTYDPARDLVIDPVIRYSTFFGSSNFEWPYDVAVDSAGDIYLTGVGAEDAFPTTPGVFDNPSAFQDAFVCKFTDGGATLVWSLLIGGTGSDEGRAIAVDATGAIYVTGFTLGEFPVTPGAFSMVHSGSLDCFVAKFSADATALIWATYVGGSALDEPRSLAIDFGLNVIVTGYTQSANYPTTPGAIDTTYGGQQDVFVTKLSPDGASLAWSTYLGGLDADYGNDVAVDSANAVVVVGQTGSSTFPATNVAFAPAFINTQDAFVLKFDAFGALLWSDRIGGSSGDSAQAVALDSDGGVFATGQSGSVDFPTTAGAYDTTLNNSQDAFVARITSDGLSLVWSTFLGGSDFDTVWDVAIDAAGGVYVCGETPSLDFPTVAAADGTRSGIRDAFVTRIRSDGAALVWSTYLGGSTGFGGIAHASTARSIAWAGGSSVYVAGYTTTVDFPVTPDALDPSENGNWDIFLTRIGGSRVLGVSSPTPNGTYGAGTVITIEVTFSDPVDVAGTPTLALATGALGAAALYASGSGTNVLTFTYTVVAADNTPDLDYASSAALVAAGGAITESGTPALLTLPPPGAPGSLGSAKNIALDTSAPVVAITSPTTEPTYSTTSSSILLAGSAVDASTVLGVTWLNSGTGSGGVADGTTSWSVTVPLTEGANLVTISATDAAGNTGSDSITVTRIAPVLRGIGPVRVWIGLKNSDDVGIRFDLKAEAYRTSGGSSTLVASGELLSVMGGGSGFNNANLQSIPLSPIAGTDFFPGDALSIKVYATNATTGSGKNSGTARLWYNDAAANSRTDVVLTDFSAGNYYLRSSFVLAPAAGSGPRQKIDVAAGAQGSPYKLFGTWSVTLP